MISVFLFFQAPGRLNLAKQYYLHSNLNDDIEVTANEDLTTDMLESKNSKESTHTTLNSKDSTHRALNNERISDIHQLVKFKEATDTRL